MPKKHRKKRIAGFGSAAVRRIRRRRLLRTRRTVYKGHRTQDSSKSFVGINQLRSSEPVENPEEDVHASTSSGTKGGPSNVASVKATDSCDERVPSTKRNPEDRVNKRQRTDSNECSGAGPSTSTGIRSGSQLRTRPELKLTDGNTDSSGTEPESSNSSPSELSELSSERSSIFNSVQWDELDEKSIAEADEFHKLYQITGLLDKGGFGTVYRGFRREDNFSVAMKHVESCRIKRTAVLLNGKMTRVPMEVGLLIQVGALSEDNGVTPELVDWYEVGNQIIIVLERPDPCMDLIDYVNSMDEVMTEHEAKQIFRQLVDAALRIRACGVFHRDIKPDNVLIETGHPDPRARFIDFGCGMACSPYEIVCNTQGTEVYTPPEYYLKYKLTPDSTTVWQLGLVLYSMLNCRRAFASVETICSSYEPPISAEISEDCRDFLRRMMDKNYHTRIAIEKLKDHPWMN